MNSIEHKQRHKNLTLPWLCGILAGCMVGPNFSPPVSPKTSSYTLNQPEKTIKPDLNEKSQSFVQNGDIPLQWWELFQSKELNQLIEKGFKNNPTVEAAQAALTVAKENFKVKFGETLLPAINAQGSATREQFSGSSFGAPSSSPSIFNLFNTAVNVSYTFDLFGGARRELESLCAQIEYEKFQLEATYLTLSSNIVTTALTDAQLRAQIKATQNLITIQESLLKIIKGQFHLGASALSNVLSQETLLAQTRATLPPLEKNLAINHHALAALIGEIPSESELPDFYIEKINLPTELPLSIPTLLVRHRPDVRASEALLHQASAQIGVATANLFPQLSLNGSYGWESNFLNTLFSPMSNIWNITGQVLQPVFQGGALLAQRRSAIAAYQQANAQYRQIVIQAFQNVADVIRSIEMDAKTLKAQLEAEEAAKKLLILTKNQYELGAVNYISLLNAQLQYQTAYLNRIQAQSLRYIDSAALFQALGGGWWNRGEQCS